MLAEQMLKRVEFLHIQEYIHRKICLKKFLIGLDQNSKRLYLCGLSQSKYFIKNEKHIPYEDGKKING
jgi:hypothetical protein